MCPSNGIIVPSKSVAIIFGRVTPAQIDLSLNKELMLLVLGLNRLLVGDFLRSQQLFEVLHTRFHLEWQQA
jgi:hypothetical protein